MNKSEASKTTIELTILASQLRRRRDEWKKKAVAGERVIKSLESRVRGLEFAHKVALAALEDVSKENEQLRNKLATYGFVPEGAAIDATLAG